MQIFVFILIGFPFAVAGFGSVMGMWIILASARARLPMPTRSEIGSGLHWALMSGVICSEILYFMYQSALVYPMSLWYFGVVGAVSAFASTAGACYRHNVR